MGVPFGETGVFGGIKPGVHTSENREMATWRQRQVAFVPKRRGVLGVCRQHFSEDAHRLYPLYRVRGCEDLLRTPISVHEHVLSAFGSAGQLGQDRRGGVSVSGWFCCRQFGWNASYYGIERASRQFLGLAINDYEIAFVACG